MSYPLYGNVIVDSSNSTALGGTLTISNSCKTSSLNNQASIAFAVADISYGTLNMGLFNNNVDTADARITAIIDTVSPTVGTGLSVSVSSNHANPPVEALRVQSNGNVGIGTQTPQFPLDVNGNIRLGTGTTGNIRFGTTGVGTTQAGYIDLINNNMTIMNHQNGNIIFGTNNAEDMRISSNGNVGIGTQTPQFPLDVSGTVYINNNSAFTSYVHMYSSRPGFLLNNDNQLPSTVGSIIPFSSFTASVIGNQSYLNIYKYRHSAGNSWFSSSTRIQQMIDDTNQGYIEFNPPNATHGIGIYGGGSVSSYGTGSGITVRNDGRVGIGPQLLTTNVNQVSIDCVNSAAVDALGCRSKSDANNIINFYNTAGALKGHVGSSSNSSVSYNSGSDRRLKENITDMGSMINKIKQLKPRHFNWISGGEKDDGFIAQELFNVLPQLRPINAFKCKTISHNEKYDGKVCSCCDLENPKRNSNGAPYIYGVDYGKLTPYLVKAIQEQQTQIEQLENTIKSQQSQIDMLLKRLENAGF